MPNRLQVNQHDIAYNFLSAYEGEYCLVGKVGHKKCEGPLQIDHADNDPSNWKPGNIHLVCRKHNLGLRKITTKEHKALMARYCAKNASEREKTKGDTPGDVLASMVDYSSGSPEMQVNTRCKILFADWVIQLINKHGQWPKIDVINAGAHITGCNPQTSRRYLDALTSSVGPFRESQDETGTTIIVLRKR